MAAYALFGIHERLSVGSKAYGLMTAVHARYYTAATSDALLSQKLRVNYYVSLHFLYIL